MMRHANIVNALTVDVEDYFQVTGFERHVSRNEWDNFPSRVLANTRRLLGLFNSKGVVATFFVLGWVAQRFPELIKEIDQAGHEIGSHGYWHRLVYQLSPGEFRDDLCQSIDALEQVIQRPVSVYRAPSFSITKRSLWSLEILAEEGIEIDSSVFPVRRRRYGLPSATKHPHRITKELIEFPMSAFQCGRINVPVSGGGYFRMYPYPVTAHLLNQLNSVCRRPFVFYIHPWEIDPLQPRLHVGSSAGRFRHYVNLSRTEGRLVRLLDDFRFGTLSQSLAAHYPDLLTGDPAHAQPVLANVSGCTESHREAFQ